MPMCKCSHPLESHRLIPEDEDICSRYGRGICHECQPCVLYRPDRIEHRAS